MDLFDLNTLSPQQKFMLMLNDKLDTLIDQVNHFKNEYNEFKLNINHIIPKEHYLMKCPDNTVYANSALIQIHLINKNEQLESEVIDYLKTLDLQNNNIHINLTKNSLLQFLHDGSHNNCWTCLWTKTHHGYITIQGIIQFTKIQLISHIGFSICQKFQNYIIPYNNHDQAIEPFARENAGVYIEPLVYNKYASKAIYFPQLIELFRL
jgi:hypothetical protein